MINLNQITHSASTPCLVWVNLALSRHLQCILKLQSYTKKLKIKQCHTFCTFWASSRLPVDLNRLQLTQEAEIQDPNWTLICPHVSSLPAYDNKASLWPANCSHIWLCTIINGSAVSNMPTHVSPHGQPCTPIRVAPLICFLGKHGSWDHCLCLCVSFLGCLDTIKTNKNVSYALVLKEGNRWFGSQCDITDYSFLTDLHIFSFKLWCQTKEIHPRLLVRN